jgi:hypothetical protein
MRSVAPYELRCIELSQFPASDLGRSVWARSLRMSSIRSIWSRGMILEIQIRADLVADQGPDTLTVFVMKSEGCEDTHQPVRDGYQWWGTRSKSHHCLKFSQWCLKFFFPGGYRRSPRCLFFCKWFVTPGNGSWQPTQNLQTYQKKRSRWCSWVLNWWGLEGSG